jgi:hypothetical protein
VKWLKDSMPDYTLKINSDELYQQLIKNENDKDINKVILFTNKIKITPVFLAVSA